jgi:hypothetical protein
LRREAGGPVVVASSTGEAGRFGSPEWLAAFREVAQKAAEIEQPLWVEVPDFHAEALRSTLMGERGQFRARVLRFDDWETRPGKWRKRRITDPILLGLASPLSERGHLNLSHALDVTQALQRFEVPGGLKASLAYRVLAFTVETSEWADCLVREATEAYLGAVLEPLLQAAGDRFGESVKGVFIPAPAILPPGAAADAIPWPPALTEAFGEQREYALIPQLPALSVDTGVAHTRVRRDYWETVSHLYAEHFLLPLRDWCHANSVQVGFLLPSETDSRKLIRACADPAVVHRLSDVRCLDDGRDLHLRVRTALALEREPRQIRCLLRQTEGASADPVRARRACLSRCASLGLDGAIVECLPREEAPAGEQLAQSLHEWQGAGHWLSGAGARRCQVAVLRPVRSQWAHYDPRRQDPLLGVVDRDLQYVAGMLASLGHEFDLVDEEVLASATLSEERLHVGGSSYEMVVLPSLTYLPSATWDLLVEFTHLGGKVAALGLLPRESGSGLDADFAAKVQADTLVDLDYVYRTYEAEAVDGEGDIDSFPIFREDLSEGRFCSYQPRLVDDQEDARLRVMQIMVESLDAEVEGLSDAVRCEHRRLADANLYVVANTSDQPCRTNVRIRRTGVPFSWRVDERVSEECLAYAVIDAAVTSLVLTLSPHEVVGITVRPGSHSHVDGANFTVTSLTEGARGLLTASGYSLKAGKAAALFEPRSGRTDWAEDFVSGRPVELPLTGPWQVRFPERNRYRLTAWQSKQGVHLPTLSTRLLGRWNRDWQTLPSAGGSPSAGSTLRTSFLMTSPVPQTTLCFAAEARLLRVFLNGEELPLGATTGGVDVSGALRSGENQLVVLRAADGDSDPLPALGRCLWLEGQFEVAATPTLDTLSPAGDEYALDLADLLLKHSYYRGPVVAATTLEVPQELEHAYLFLALEECAYPAEAEVNGAAVGLCWQPPHRFQVTDRARPGANDVKLRLHVTSQCAGPPLQGVSLLAFPAVHLTFDPAGIRTGETSPRQAGVRLSPPGNAVELN